MEVASREDAIIALRRRLDWLEGLDSSDRSSKAREHDRREAAGLRRAIAELQADRYGLDWATPATELCDAIDRLQPGYTEEAAPVWKWYGALRALLEVHKRATGTGGR